MQKWKVKKDPADVDYYAVEIDPVWLDGNIIDNATVTAGIESALVIDNITFDAPIVRFRVSGGVVGLHPVTVNVQSAGRIRERSVALDVRER